MTTKLEIPADVVPHRMVLYTAGLHGRAHPGEFPSQPVENSFDAGATDVWVVLKGGKHPSLTVIDNGSGMLPDILPEDHKRLEKHLADLRDPEKEIPEDFDIFKEISEASLHSLMWMIRYIGLSPHVKGEDPYLMALLGIGTKAFYVWANAVTYFTRPNFRLAKAFWGSSITQDEVPTIFFQPPTGVELKRGRSNNLIEYPSEIPLKDHKGNLMQHGTRVEFTGLKTGVLEKLTPGVVSAYLSGRFGKVLREKAVRLTIIDQVTEAGISEPDGIEIPVRAPVYDVGVLLYDRTDFVSVEGTPYPVEIQIRYKPGKRLDPKARVKIRRGGNEACTITDVPELSFTPWDGVTGYADFPDIPGKEDSLWTPDKLFPLPNTPAYNHWVQHMMRVAEYVMVAMADHEAKIVEESQQQIASRVTTSVLKAMQNLPAFSNLVLPKRPPTKKPQKVKKVKKPVFVETRTFASVVSKESGRGIRGLTIQLLKEGRILSNLETDTSGRVSFGELAYGRYKFKLVTIPKGARLAPEERQEVVFNINENYPRKDYVFTLIVPGDTKPVKLAKVQQGLRVWAHELISPEELYYFGRLSLGMVEINTGTEEHRQAVMDKDEELQLLIQELYASSAMTELAFLGPPPEDEKIDETRALYRVMAIQMSKLFVRAYTDALMVQRAEARRKKRE